MLIKLMRSKIHRARITQRDPDYIGSITIDEDLLRQSDLRPNEAVLVLDIDNAARFETYVIRGEPGAGVIGINGAAAKLVEIGHRVIILGFGYLAANEIDDHVANVVVCNEDNRVVQRLQYPSTIDQTVEA